jgi:hydrogenase/urease accessory protein HupE
MLRFITIFIVSFFLSAPLSHAHLMPAGKGTINLIGNLSYVLISLPIQSFPIKGAPQNLELSPEVLKKNETFLKSWFREHLVLKNGSAKAVWLEVFLSLNPKHQGDQSNELVVMAIAKFSDRPQNISIRSELWASEAEPIQLTSTLSEAGKVVNTQVTLLSKENPEAFLFPSHFSLLKQFFKLGIEHIFFGFDHLVFLFSILITGMSKKRWLYILSFFTIAHCMTIALVLLKIIPTFSHIVEPAIAGSIVLIAAFHLLGKKLSLLNEVLLVFGLGLIHGLGFAGSVISLEISHSQIVLFLLGFNLGIEFAQLLVAVMGASVVFLFSKLRLWGSFYQWQRLAAILSLSIGLYWLTERLFF